MQHQDYVDHRGSVDTQRETQYQSHPLFVTLYPLSALALITLYVNHMFTMSFALSALLVTVGVTLATISMRRYRQRLNYVEGLEQDLGQEAPVPGAQTSQEAALQDDQGEEAQGEESQGEESQGEGSRGDEETGGAEAQAGASSPRAQLVAESLELSQAKPTRSALTPHWIDALGDRGVGVVSFLMLILVVPTLLASAAVIPELKLFADGAVHELALWQWVVFVMIETLGLLTIVFEYFGMASLRQLAELSEGFSLVWKLFMVAVQVGVISLVFDVLRRYLDLNSTLDRFASTALLSTDKLLIRERALHSYLNRADRDQQRERQLTHEYQSALNDLQLRVDTLARFLTVFEQRRIINTLTRAIMTPKKSALSVEVTPEGRAQLLSSLLVSGARGGGDTLSARSATHIALDLFTAETPVALRIAALNVLGSYHPLLQPQARLSLSELDHLEALMCAREQAQLGSAHSVSIELSIDYERLTLAASYVLATSGERSAIASLLMLRLSDSLLLRDEGDQRIHHLLGSRDADQQVILSMIVELIELSEQSEVGALEDHVGALVDTLRGAGDNLLISDAKLDVNLSQLMFNHLVAHARGPGALRFTTERLGQLDASGLGLTLWSVLQRPLDAQGALMGIIEGAQSSDRVYREVSDQLIQTLRFGAPHEVRHNQQLCSYFADPDSLVLPQIFMSEVDALWGELQATTHQTTRLNLEAQLFNLIGGMSRLNLSAHATLVNTWLDAAEWPQHSSRLDRASVMLYAVTGDEARFTTLFEAYLEHAQRLYLEPEGEGEEGPGSSHPVEYELISILDPTLRDIEGDRVRLWAESRVATDWRAADVRPFVAELIQDLQEHTTAPRFAWLWTLLNVDGNTQLGSSLIQRLRTRVKHLCQADLKPMVAANPQDWMRDEVKRRTSFEDRQTVMAQWLKLLGSLSGQLSGQTSERELDESLSFLFGALDGELPLRQATVLTAAAETIGSVSKSASRLTNVTSADLIERFPQIRAQGAKAGILRALGNIQDSKSLEFLSELASDAEGRAALNAQGFAAMTRALHSAHDLEALSQLLGDVDRLGATELGELLQPFGDPSLPLLSLREHLDEPTVNIIRNLVVEKLCSEGTPANLLASCVGVVPQVVTADDQEVSDLLFDVVQRAELRQSHCEKIARVTALTFPEAFTTRYDEVLGELVHNNQPKWMVGLQYVDPERCVAELLSLAERYAHVPEQINANNVTAMVGPLLKHGGSRGRKVVYQWLKSYSFIAYAIVRWIGSHGSMSLDGARLKDELYRNQRQIAKLRDDASASQEKLKSAAQLRVELLNTLYRFGEHEALAQLISIAVREPQSPSYIDLVLRSEALRNLPAQVRSLFMEGDEE